MCGRITRDMQPFAIQPYNPQGDEQQVYALWQRMLGHLWPLSRASFRRVTVAGDVYRPGDHLVALAGHEVVGFAGTQAWLVPGECTPRGELLLMMVDPAYQRRGIGRTLLERALIVLKERGAEKVQVGGGGRTYFWPGVPANLPAAWPFFQACGWTEAERSFDLVQDLSDYATPPGVYERVRLPNVTITTAGPEDAPQVLAFERQHFPEWLPFYQGVLEQGGHADVVLARHPDHGIVGASCAGHPRVVWQRPDFVWEQLLGENVGELGPLGVLEAARENGIGLALAARVTGLLRERGAKTAYVGWTWLVDWYGKLGYHIWQEYVMSWARVS